MRTEIPPESGKPRGDEVLEKTKRDPRFRRVTGVWAKMRPDWIELLSDNETPELAAVVGA